MITVVMPVYNVAQWVEAAIWSILRQTFTDLELIVVDDGSTDETVDCVMKINDSRLRLLRLEHQGQFMARNIGILEAKGDWIAGMDGDDISHPDRLKTQIDVLRSNPEHVICGTAFGYICPNGQVVQRRSEFRFRELTPSIVTKGMRCADASMAFRRDMAIEEGLFDVDIPMNEKSLWYKLLKRGKGIAIESCYYFVRLREGASNIGKIGGAMRGRAARRRYDPEYRDRHANLPLPTPQNIQHKGIITKLRIYQTAGDYSSALCCALEAWRSQSTLRAFRISFLAITGLKTWRFWHDSYSSNIQNYIKYEPESERVAQFLISLGLRLPS